MVVVNLAEHERAFLSRHWSSSRIFVNQSFVLDHVSNPSNASYFDIVPSVLDTTAPAIQTPLSIDLNNGELWIAFSEFVDLDTLDATRWKMNELIVEGSASANATDLVNGSSIIAITVSEALRNTLVLRSLESFQLVLYDTGLTDFAGNALPNTTLTLALVLDTTAPQVTGASIHTRTGILTIHTSEFVDYSRVRHDLFTIDQSLGLGTATLLTGNASYGYDLVLQLTNTQRVETLYRMAGWKALSVTVLGSSFYDAAGNGFQSLGVFEFPPDNTFNETLVFGVSLASAVKDFVASVYFYGTGLSRGDAASWVANGSTSCDSPVEILGTHVNTSTRGLAVQDLSLPVETSPLNVTFAESQSIEPGFVLCYNGVIYPQFGIVVRSLTGVACADTGCSIDFIPATQQQLLEISGDGVSAGDRYKWIRSTEDCDKAGHRVVQPGNVLQDSFGSGWIGANISLCYKFSAENEYKHFTSFSRQVYGLEYSSLKIQLVEGRPKQIFFSEGSGISLVDRYKWVVSRCDGAGETSPYSFVNSTAPVNTTVSFEEVNASSANVFVLCYSFQSTEYVLYNEITLHTVGFVSYSVDEGSKEAVLVNDNKMFRFFGVGFSLDDRVAWTTNSSDFSSCTSNGLAAFSRSLTTANGAYTAGFTQVGTYTLCYGFGTEPFVIVPTVSVSVKDMFRIVSNYTVVALQKSLLQLVGFGIAQGDTAGFSLQGTPCGQVGTSTESATVDENHQVMLSFPMVGDYELCYTFGIETIRSYRQIKVRAVGVASIDRYLLIRGKSQQVKFGGMGIRGGDFVRFMDGAISDDQDCEDEANVFLEFMVNQYVTPPNFSLPLQTHPLCYKYQSALAFKAYPDLTVRVVGVSSVSVNHVVIGEEKKFVYSGVGISSADTVKWIDVDELLDPSDALCEQFPSLTETLDVVIARDADISGTSVHNFQSESKKPALCYAFEGHIFRLYEFPLGINTVRSGKEVLAIQHAPLIIDIEASIPSHSDRVKFVGSNCSETTKEYAPVNGLVNVSLDTVRIAKLCYYHGQETAYTAYSNFTVNVVPPVISTASTLSFVSGVPKSIRLTGSFGVTTNDVAKLLPQNATSCLDDGVEFIPENASLQADEPMSGSVDLLLDIGSVSLPWFLCYRFGWSEYISFREFSFFGHVLESMMILSEEVDEEQTTIQMEMRGVGIADGDLAKWVSLSCEEEGISETEIMDDIATFTFEGSVTDLMLCYKFNEEPYAHFPLAKVIQQEAEEVETISVEEDDALQTQQAEVTMTLDLSLSDIEDVQAFKDTLKTDIAAAIGVDASRIIVQSVKPGSVIVDFVLLPPPFDSGQLNVQQALEILDEVVRVQKSGSGNATSTLLSYVKGNTFVVQVKNLFNVRSEPSNKVYDRHLTTLQRATLAQQSRPVFSRFQGTRRMGCSPLQNPRLLLSKSTTVSPCWRLFVFMVSSITFLSTTTSSKDLPRLGLSSLRHKAACCSVMESIPRIYPFRFSMTPVQGTISPGLW